MERQDHSEVVEIVANKFELPDAMAFSLSKCTQLSAYFPNRAEFECYLEGQLRGFTMWLNEKTNRFDCEALLVAETINDYFSDREALLAAENINEYPSDRKTLPVTETESTNESSNSDVGLTIPSRDQAIISNPYVALAVLKYLRQPFYFDQTAPFFQDPGFWKQGLELCPKAFAMIPDNLRCDKDVALVATTQEPAMFKFAGGNLRSDKSFAASVVYKEPYLLEFCSVEVRASPWLVGLACAADISAVQYASPALLVQPVELKKLRAVWGQLDETAQQDAAIIASCVIAGVFVGTYLPQVLLHEVEAAKADCRARAAITEKGAYDHASLTQAIIKQRMCANSPSQISYIPVEGGYNSKLAREPFE